jgi:ABC-type phosphate transport system substrate-binding protein
MRHRIMTAGVAAAAVLTVVGLTAVGLAGSAAAGAPRTGAYVTINGSGSSWASVAIDQWSQDVEAKGITVNFNPDGSAQGLQDYIQGQDDFTASDLPFRAGRDKIAGLGPQKVRYGFSYVPDVAGGTSFVYHLTARGHRILNLRLSGPTILKIFTGQIRNWDNRQITRDYGHQLPSIPIIPVVHSEGSGDTFFLTRWMATEFPRQWDAFCRKVTHGRIRSDCGPTAFYPTSGWGNVKAENGSTNVVTFVDRPFANGAIGYDEYAYALNAHAPVAALRNPAGRYVLPSATNVTVALTAAQIDENPHSADFLQQNLDRVYTFRNPRSYPLSSYSYLVVPRTGRKPAPPTFSRAKGRTLSTFVAFLLCPQGQRQVPALGYAKLPANLVRGGLLQAGHIPGHIRIPQLGRRGCRLG